MDLWAELTRVKREFDSSVSEPIEVSKWNKEFGRDRLALLVRVVLLEGTPLLVEMSQRGYTVLFPPPPHSFSAVD